MVMCCVRSPRRWLWTQGWPCTHAYDKYPPKLLPCIRLGPVSVTGRGEKQQAAKGTKSTILENSWKAKQAISNRASCCLCQNIKMSAVQRRSRKFRHGKFIRREKARSGSQVDCLNFPSCFLLPELVMFPQFSLPIRLPQSSLLDAVDSQFDDIWLSVCCFYISATCYLFTFACYLLNRLPHSKTRLSWPIL